MIRSIAFCSAAAAAVITLCQSAAAQPADDALAALLACAEETDDGARLDCFDDAIAPLRVVADAADEEFVIAPASVRDAGAARAPREPVQATITRMEENAFGRTRFFLENGQVWMQTDGGAVRTPHGDQALVAHIRPAALGSYFLRINDRGPRVRVRLEE